MAVAQVSSQKSAPQTWMALMRRALDGRLRRTTRNPGTLEGPPVGSADGWVRKYSHRQTLPTTAFLITAPCLWIITIFQAHATLNRDRSYFVNVFKTGLCKNLFTCTLSPICCSSETGQPMPKKQAL